MTTITLPKEVLAGAGAVLALAAVAFVLVKFAGGIQQAGVAAGKAAGDAAAGVVVGIGESVGIPQTNNDQCSADLAAGRTWAASFSCPAKRFITEGLFGSSEPNNGEGVGPVPRAGGATGTWWT